MKRFLFIAFVLFGLLWGYAQMPVQAGSLPAPPPENPVKLIFIHHSTGENWLMDGYGNLGHALAENNYFVSDTNYGWGPDYIGDRTDIVNWREWFQSTDSDRYLTALYQESGQNSAYTRLFSDPGGDNQVIMFKSCFPNSALEGGPDDPPDSNEGLTVGHAKFVYNDLLNYFSTRPDRLFIVITAPPLQDPSYADNARAFNNWLVHDWLAENNYTLGNVAVFDFYNVLTHPDNHHTAVQDSIEHTQNGINTLYYDSAGDDHPNEAGSQKATDEFIPLLNLYYHHWISNTPVAPPAEPPPAEEPEDREAAPTATDESAESAPESPAPQAAPSTVIDDFDESAPEGSEGWVPFWDTATPTQLDCQLEEGALKIDFDIAANSWGTCALMYPSTMLDLSNAEGITFAYRASSPGLVFNFDAYAGAPDARATYLYTIESVPASVDGWVVATLPWGELRRAEWEADAGTPIDPSAVNGFAFGFSTFPDTPNTGTIWIDNLQLTGMEDQLESPPPAEEAPQPESEPTASAPIEAEASPTPMPPPEDQPAGRGCPGSMALAGFALLGFASVVRKRKSGV